MRTPKLTSIAIILMSTVYLWGILSVMRPNTIEPIISPVPSPIMQRSAFGVESLASGSSIELFIKLMNVLLKMPRLRADIMMVGYRVMIRLSRTSFSVSMMSSFVLRAGSSSSVSSVPISSVLSAALESPYSAFTGFKSRKNHEARKQIDVMME